MAEPVSPTAAADASRYRVDERLLDATRVTLRAIRADDKERLDRHFHSLSSDSVVQRFFKAKADLTAADLVYFTEVDFDHHFALVAILQDEEDAVERIVGVGRAIESSSEPRTAEVAFAVADAHQGRGIGTLLLRHLAKIGRGLGYHRFEAWVLPGNGRMLDVFLNSGFTVRKTLEDGSIHVRFPIADGAAAADPGG